MRTLRTSRHFVVPITICVVLLTVVACDRQDNYWDAYEPTQKILIVETDTLNIGEDGARDAFTVTLPMVPADTVRIMVAVDPAQAVAEPETVVIAPVDDEWAQPRTVVVSARDDAVDEGRQSLTVAVAAVSRDAAYDGQGGVGMIPVEITDNDRAGVLVSETELTMVESTEGVVGETYRLRLLSEPIADVTITPSVAPDESSFHMAPASLVFTPANWQDEQKIDLWAELDQVDADNLSLVISHSAVSNDPNYDGRTDIGSVAVSLLDNTLPPTASLTAAVPGATSVIESDGTESVAVVIALDRPSVLPVTVHLATIAETATAAVDFVALDEDITFAPGEPLSRTVPVYSLDDNLIENAETFQVVISAVDHVQVGELNRLDLTVLDDDQVTISAVGGAVDEDTGSAAFTVSISYAVPLPVGFRLTTADGTALAGADYEAVAADFVIAAGQTERVVPVVILADAAHEGDETLTATIDGLDANAVWDGVAAQVTIRNDDPQAIALPDVEFGENAAQAVFAIDLLAPYNDPVTLTVTTRDGDGQGAAAGPEDAVGGLDFGTATAAEWIIPAGATSAEFAVDILNDLAPEATREFFRLEVVSASEPGFAGLTAVCGLVDDDQPQLVVSDASVLESDTEALFSVFVRDNKGAAVTSEADISFTYATANQTAEAGLDYVASGATVVIPAGTDSVGFTVPIIEDSHDDDNETFVLDLTAPVNATIMNDGTAPFCLIVDNEFPSLNLNQAVEAENEGSVHVFTVYLTTQRQDSTAFRLDLADSTTDGMAPDYEFTAAGYHVIPPFTSSLSFSVSYVDDQLAGEADEIVKAVLSEAEVALGIKSLEMTILDAPALNVGSDSALEGENLVFVASLTEASTADIRFGAQYSSGSANVLEDIDSSNVGPFVIPAGETTLDFSVPTLAGDGGDLAVEDFVTTLVNPVNATLGAFNSGVGSITDGDPPFIQLGADATAVEGNGLIFEANLSWSSEADVSFYVTFTDGTAAGSNIDYDSFSSGPFTVSAGALSTTIPVQTTELDGPELAVEDFVLTLINPANGLLGARVTANGYIEDGDQPEITIPLGDSVVEGGTLNFTVHLDVPTIVPVFFNLLFDNGSTQGVADFVPSGTGPFSLMPGTTDTTITVGTVDDTIFENVEQFVVHIDYPATNAILGVPAQANGVINDND